MRVRQHRGDFFGGNKEGFSLSRHHRPPSPLAFPPAATTHLHLHLLLVLPLLRFPPLRLKDIFHLLLRLLLCLLLLLILLLPSFFHMRMGSLSQDSQSGYGDLMRNRLFLSMITSICIRQFIFRGLIAFLIFLVLFPMLFAIYFYILLFKINNLNC